MKFLALIFTVVLFTGCTDYNQEVSKYMENIERNASGAKSKEIARKCKNIIAPSIGRINNVDAYILSLSFYNDCILQERINANEKDIQELRSTINAVKEN